jgi:DNA adenine methylase
LSQLPDATSIKGKFVEPFVGGGAVYFALAPQRADLGDINPELIELYQGIAKSPDRVWRLYRSYPTTKVGYKQIRRLKTSGLTLLQRAARSLFLNRTCFKGMWRHNLRGQFNIGYGGQDRRWSITRADLFDVSEQLQRAKIACCDFEGMIDGSTKKDFVFLDPPYRPGAKEQIPNGNSADPQDANLFGAASIFSTLASILSAKHESALLPIQMAHSVASLSTYPSAKVLSIFAEAMKKS